MDSNLIYQKTAAGEDAMRHRSRLVQRHLRTVLILVDGKKTVAQLCEKIGNSQSVEEALAELEKGDFVALVADQPSPVDKSMSTLPEEQLLVANEPPDFATDQEEPPVSVDNPPPPESQPDSDSMSLPPSEEPVPDTHLPPIAPEPVPLETKAAAPAKASWLSRLETPPPEAPAKTAKQEKPTRAPKRSDGGARSFSLPLPAMGWPRLFAYLSLGLVAAFFALLFLYPYDRHRAEAEALLGSMAGQEVRIDHLGFQLMPRPGLEMDSVHVGGESGVRIAKIRVRPDLGTLGQGTRVMREMEVSGATIPLPMLLELSRWLAAGSDRPVRIEHLRVSQLSLQLGSFVLANLAGEVSFGSNGEVSRLSLENSEHSVKLDGVPRDGALELNLEAAGWSAGEAAPRFTSLSGHGLLTPKNIALDSIDARTLDGLWQGKLNLGWSRGYNLESSLSAKAVSVRKLSAALGREAKLDGEIGGNFKLSASGADWPQMISQLQGEGAFTVGRGLIGNMDLAEAVRRSAAPTIKGGETRFEQLGGRFRFDPKGLQLSDVQLNAGPLQAAGKLAVGEAGKLDGALEVVMRSSANQMRMPVALRGSLAEPLLQPGRR
ncbi:MAG TPA: AsmA-like C-terminal region-containing protein [Azospira sp.]|nr:AsmA-like C-terminal region-containing protein [Azospira sp.]